MMLLRPDVVHESRAIGPQRMTYYCLHFNADDRILRELLCQGRTFYYAESSRLARTLRPGLDQLISLTSEPGPVKLANKMRTLSVVFELFAGLSEVLAEQSQSETAGARVTRIAGEIAARLERFVEEPVMEEVGGMAAAPPDITGETVAAVTGDLGYSASSCNRMFHRVFGMSPRQYLSALKLKKAKLLLMEPSLSVEEVSVRLGYKDIAHFSRQFKRWTGEPPGKFRARFHI